MPRWYLVQAPTTCLQRNRRHLVPTLNVTLEPMLTMNRVIEDSGRFATESHVTQRYVHFTSSTRNCDNREKIGTDLVPPTSHDLLTLDQSGTRLTKWHNNQLIRDYDRRKSTIYRYSLKGLEREMRCNLSFSYIYR